MYKIQIPIQFHTQPKKIIYNRSINKQILTNLHPPYYPTNTHMGKLNPKLTPQQIRLKKKQQKIRKKQNKKEFLHKKQEIKSRLEERKADEETQNNEIQQENFIEENQNILTGKYYDYFKQVFEKNLEKAKKYFPAEAEENDEESDKEEEEGDKKDGEAAAAAPEDGEEKYSRKQMKRMRWLKVAQLKALVKRPDLVEAWDITAPNPLFLCDLKTVKNTIPVPRHWNQKSKFLQTKRGILKPMFKLPQFIEATGISKLRDPFSQRDGSKMVREKLKQRMNPRLGKIDIDYQVLHDAFFKYQLKSNLSVFGDIYYEGKQDESKAKEYKPGLVSEPLRLALGISDYQAPPWIINMQRYGAPPSYPTLRILGSALPFSQLQSYTMINKSSLQECARKLGQPGLYATFRTYYEDDEEEFVDKGYWGQVAHVEIEEEEPEEGWEEDNEEL